jgi:hypothetical protein
MGQNEKEGGGVVVCGGGVVVCGGGVVERGGVLFVGEGDWLGDFDGGRDDREGEGLGDGEGDGDGDVGSVGMPT